MIPVSETIRSDIQGSLNVVFTLFSLQGFALLIERSSHLDILQGAINRNMYCLCLQHYIRHFYKNITSILFI